MKKVTALILTATALGGLSGCTTSKQVSGNLVTEQQQAKIRTGMSRSEVEKLLGTPSFVNPKDSNIVYYYGELSNNRMLVGKTLEKAKTVEITYSLLNHVKSVRTINRKEAVF